jgi:hypothetical protein
MKSLFAAAAALTLLATPVLAQDAEALAQTPVFQSIPAHQAVPDLASNGPAGDAEAHAQNVYTVQNVGTLAASQAVTTTDAASTAAKPQVTQDESWRDQP